MIERLTIFTAIPPSHQSSPEFMLCLKMFRDALPENSSIITTKDNDPFALRSLIVKHISDIAPYALIVKEPAILIRKGTVETMLQIMETYQDMLCVLPSDIRGFRQGRTANYYTLRGFEKFADSLYDPEYPIMPYDGREPWMFLIKDIALRLIEIPEDPLTLPRLLYSENTCIALNTYIHPFINYYEETRSDVLQFVPDGIGSFLDIGCARGRFGASVKNKIGCRVVGVELNSYEAQKAKEHLDLVIVGDFLTTEIEEKFDCITCLDVIEHVTDPEAFLQKIKTLLNDDGYILLSIPNIGHWSVVEDLISGRWDYTPAGILCISHLRFFTRKTIHDLLKDTGFRIVMIGEQVVPMPEYLKEGFHFLKQNAIEIDEKSLSCLGYYILAQKAT